LPAPVTTAVLPVSKYLEIAATVVLYEACTHKFG